MDLKQALRILGLGINYTDEELRVAYKKLIKKHHPDLFQDVQAKRKAEEITKQINEANIIAKSNLNNKNKPTRNIDNDIKYPEDTQLKILKKKYKEEALEELKFIRSINNLDLIFDGYRERFEELINKFYKKIDSVLSFSSLEFIYQSYREEYFKLACWYNYDTWEKSKIFDFVKGGSTITIETTLKEIRRNKIYKINELLLEELDKYKDIEDYNIFESLLIKTMGSFVYVCLFGYADINKTKEDFNMKAKEIINKYYKRKKLLDELIKSEGAILPHSIELYNLILNEEAFYRLYDTIDKPSKIKRIIKKVFKNK